jgi:hypothetical protein
MERELARPHRSRSESTPYGESPERADRRSAVRQEDGGAAAAARGVQPEEPEGSAGGAALTLPEDAATGAGEASPDLPDPQPWAQERRGAPATSPAATPAAVLPARSPIAALDVTAGVVAPGVPTSMPPASAAQITGVAADPLQAVFEALAGSADASEPAPEENLATASGSATDGFGDAASSEESSALRTASERSSPDGPVGPTADRAFEGSAPRSTPAAVQAWLPGQDGTLPEALEEPVDGSQRASKPEQGADVFKQVRMHLAAGSATLLLEPAWLGRVSIRVALRGGRAKAELRTEGVEALAALERHLPELRAALAARGLEGAELELGLGIGSLAGGAPPALRGGPTLAVPADIAGPGASAVTAGARSPNGIDTYA